ncbi:LOW QUALITY PROTEIN: CX3C chemokine receptor 1 [Dipodomys spectabilis]|uniref:LOW QUALITY PROTEIN: CX3C chemokine receptor 1 n=1 Tax=Dipodomys spectabilis TaxID=105255 RepID=UPI001C53E739|nr:LOW QUALITY PROTEIN: CX3C chemokine receptor 1 [Dipodomys spectabilis]
MATSEPAYDLENFEYDTSAEACSLEDVVALGAIFLPVWYSLVFAVGLVGNTLVVLAVGCGPGRRTRGVTDVYLLNLALSDLLFVATLPVWTHYVISPTGLPHAACALVTTLFFVGFFAGVFFVTLISVDRYVAIVRPAAALGGRSASHGVTRSLGVWGAALLAAAPQFMFTGRSQDECLGVYPASLQLAWPVLRAVEATLLGFALPALVLTFCSCRITRVLCVARDPRKTRALRLVLLVVVAFLVFWTPYQVLLVLDTLRLFDFFPDCNARRELRLALTLAETLAFSHCCLNPIIYTFAGDRFRGYLRQLARKWLAGSDPPQSPRSESMPGASHTLDTSEGNRSVLL